jgi:hypothetical protein
MLQLNPGGMYMPCTCIAEALLFCTWRCWCCGCEIAVVDAVGCPVKMIHAQLLRKSHMAVLQIPAIK